MISTIVPDRIVPSRRTDSFRVALLPTGHRFEGVDWPRYHTLGATPLVHATKLEQEVGFKHLYLKREGTNFSGSQKDRLSFEHVKNALRLHHNHITLATCGNFGESMAAMCRAFNMLPLDTPLKCTIFLPVGAHAEKCEARMRACGAKIIHVDGSYEDAVLQSRAFAEKHHIYDANPGGKSNVRLELRAYRSLAYEIYDQLGRAPDIIAVPASNGGTAAGIAKAFRILIKAGVIGKMPQIVIGSSANQNPIVASYERYLSQGLNLDPQKHVIQCLDLDPKAIHYTPLNESLANSHSFVGDAALRAVIRSGGWAAHVDDILLEAAAELIKSTEKIDVLPASAAGLVALTQRHEREPLLGKVCVAVLTAEVD